MRGYRAAGLDEGAGDEGGDGAGSVAPSSFVRGPQRWQAPLLTAIAPVLRSHFMYVVRKEA